MSVNNKNNFDDQEINLSAVSAKINELFEGISGIIFKMIRFVIEHIIIMGILFVIGFGLGSYLDKSNKVYNNEIIVQPNFGTTDYLYSRVELLASKIKQKDTVFLKSIGFKNTRVLQNVKIEPIIDVYKFISGSDKDRNEQNFELLKLMAEDSDMKKIVKEETTSKNYAFHLISFTTNKLINRDQIVDPLMKFLNNSAYFNQIRGVYLKNAQVKIQRNNEIIAQIDKFLNDYSSNEASAKSDRLIYYNENTQLNDIIQTKNGLIAEIGKLQIDLVGMDKIIKPSSVTLNVQDTKGINGKLKLIFPVLFVFLYMVIYFFINFYKKQSIKYNPA